MDTKERASKIRELVGELEKIPYPDLDNYEIGEYIDTDGGGYTIVQCPVCGAKTLSNWWVCQHCGWEYDYTPNYDEYSDANGATLKEYIEAYNLMVSENV